MNFDEHTYRLLEIGGNWLSGLGSLSAVLVALYLARAQRAVRLKINAGARLIITPGRGQDGEVVDISVANVGDRPVEITNVLWKMGVLRRRCAVQVTGSAMDSLKIHGRLEPGNRGSFYIELDPSDRENWVRRCAQDMPKHFRAVWLRRLKVGIATAVGTTTWASVEDSLRKELLDTAQALDRERS